MTDAESQTAHALSDRLVVEFAPELVLLFGSRATGNARADSDFDLLVVAKTELPLHQRLFRARWSTRDVPVARDIVVVTPEEFKEYSAWPSSVVHQAAVAGEVLYERAA